MITGVRLLKALPREESLRLLGSTSLGRVVFTHFALPAIRPVNHIVEGDTIIIRTHLGAAIASAVDGTGTVVAYEADMIDPDDHLGWSVIVIGKANRLTDPGEIARYRQVLQPWVSGAMDEIIVITSDMVDGFRLVRDPA
ncbi:MAG TPA: pyridoxamine 5'-phosphate oxidase family protein [Streptosporangiaceae bacterium]